MHTRIWHIERRLRVLTDPTWWTHKQCDIKIFHYCNCLQSLRKTLICKKKKKELKKVCKAFTPFTYIHRKLSKSKSWCHGFGLWRKNYRTWKEPHKPHTHTARVETWPLVPEEWSKSVKYCAMVLWYWTKKFLLTGINKVQCYPILSSYNFFMQNIAFCIHCISIDNQMAFFQCRICIGVDITWSL